MVRLSITYTAPRAMFRLARAETQHLRMLAQPGVDVAFDHRPLAVQTHSLAVGDAHAADFEFGRFGEKRPEGFAGFFYAHAVQVEAAFERDLPDLELAHLAFLHAVTGPHQLVFGADVNHELIGQAVNGGGVGAHGGGLAQLGDLCTVSLGFAGVGAVVLDRLDALDRTFEQGKSSSCMSASAKGAQFTQVDDNRCGDVS